MTWKREHVSCFFGYLSPLMTGEIAKWYNSILLRTTLYNFQVSTLRRKMEPRGSEIDFKECDQKITRYGFEIIHHVV